MRVIGIDVGKRGAVAVIFPSAPMDVTDIPLLGEGRQAQVDVRRLACWLDDTKALAGSDGMTVAFIELAMAMPSQADAFGNRRGMGAASAFNFGRAVGALHATISLLGITAEIVTPRKWKDYFAIPKGSDKEVSRKLALQRFPNSAFQFTAIKHHQRAEAALIALYGWEKVMRDGGPGDNGTGS